MSFHAKTALWLIGAALLGFLPPVLILASLLAALAYCAYMVARA